MIWFGIWFLFDLPNKKVKMNLMTGLSGTIIRNCQVVKHVFKNSNSKTYPYGTHKFPVRFIS